MSRIVATLSTALDKLSRLEQLLGERDAGDQACELAAELRSELERARTEASALSGSSRGAGSGSRGKKEVVEKCPVCTLRSFRMARNAEQSDDGSALYRCSSCGHQESR